MNKNQLKHHIKNQAILSTAIDTTYPDKCFIRLSRVKALIDSELSHNVKNSTDNQRQAFSDKLKAQTETVSDIKQHDHRPDLYIDAYTMEIVSTCIVARINHMPHIDALINDHRIDILYHQ